MNKDSGTLLNMANIIKLIKSFVSIAAACQLLHALVTMPDVNFSFNHLLFIQIALQYYWL